MMKSFLSLFLAVLSLVSVQGFTGYTPVLGAARTSQVRS